MVKEVVVINKKNQNIFWQDVITKEMENVKIAFQVITCCVKAPNHNQFLDCHMLLDIKMEDFHKIAQLVGGSHAMYAQYVITYSSVFTIEMVHIAQCYMM